MKKSTQNSSSSFKINLLTIKDVASILKVHPLTVYSYIKKGYITAIKFDRSIRIPEQDLYQFIETRKTRG